MSRLTDLIVQAKGKDPTLGNELEREFRALANRRAFGLNFERHAPESVELPGRPIRKGDKVRVLPPRGSTDKGDQRLWKVNRTHKQDGKRVAELTLYQASEPEAQTVAVEDLIVVAEFRDYIYPGLVSTGKVERGGDKPYHTVINGENFHALEALTYTHRGKIDVIYIDPPYNTGAKDWKYNNDYVEGDDMYRHSKWLAFMERRLKLAAKLLNPENSTLIVSIDEKEYLRLGLLLEQVFPEARIQMITTVINPKGTSRPDLFSRVDEYLFVALFGSAEVPGKLSKEHAGKRVRWRYLRREDLDSVRGSRPRQFYPVFVNSNSRRIEAVGEPLALEDDVSLVVPPTGCTAVFPIREDGLEMEWGLTGPSLMKAAANGFARATPGHEKQPFIISYLTAPNIKKVEAGELQVIGLNEDGSKVVVSVEGKLSRPSTVWREKSHSAGDYGTKLVSAFVPSRKFPFPKSLYAVEDSIRFFVEAHDSATILDFFSGSGTTAHAVMRLNKQDGGRRQCISVTNNEVTADEHKALRQQKLRPGDPEWEQWGICDYITKPRIKAAISGQTPDGDPIKGEYKFTDEFPMADGFAENAEFFTLTYETPVSVNHNRAFARIAPLLWMKAGSEGRRIDTLPDAGWDVADTYGLLTDLDAAAPYIAAIEAKDGIRIAYVVTDDDRRFQSVAQGLPDGVDAVRLYESYLTNFRFSMGR
ncbi:MAG: site-specific DNA-methyltransferase [Pseudooceanicola sp.]|nr:site-specific DNA-methyltransferase [Pseudooceanicola sp.]